MITIVLSLMLLIPSMTGTTPIHSDDPPQPAGDRLRQVWYPLENGMEVGLLPLPSRLPAASQEVSIITAWKVGADHDPVGLSGRTHLAAQYLASQYLATNGNSATEHPAEVQAGSHQTWIIEKVAPAQLSQSIEAIVNTFDSQQVDEARLQRCRDQIRSLDRSGTEGDADRLSRLILDALDPLASGARGLDQLDQISAQEIGTFLARTYHPGTVRIAIVGPYDPAPIIQMMKESLATIDAGEELIIPPVLTTTPGELDPITTTVTDHGMVACGWRVPRPGTLESLPLGLFVPRLRRALEAEKGTCSWNPILEPEIVIIRQPIVPSPSTAEQRITRAKNQLMGAVSYALDQPVSGELLMQSRSGTAILLGAYRVHDPTSMIDPYPAAQALMLRRVFDMNESQLRNNFGRMAEDQLKKLKKDHIQKAQTVTGILTP